MVRDSSSGNQRHLTGRSSSDVRARHVVHQETNIRLLLLEDHIGDARLFEENLNLIESQCYALTVVTTLTEALYALERDAFDIVLCDLNVPDSSGLSTVTRLLVYAETVPVLVLTGLADEEKALEALKEGAQDYLIKNDISPALLRRTLNYTLERFTYQKQAEARLKASQDRFKRLTEAAFEAIIVCRGEELIDANDNFCRLFGFDYADVMGKPVSSFVTVHEAETALEKIVSGHEDAFEVTCLKKDHSSFFAEMRAKVISSEIEGTETRVIAIHDITSRKRGEARLHYEAFHDTLTGLKNRAAFAEQLEQAYVYNRRHPDKQFAVLFIDLDKFKPVNDRCGHSVGDQLLIAVARRLKATVRATDTVARLGGDEFILLLRDTALPEDATLVADNILKALGKPFTVQGYDLSLSASVGIALSSQAAGSGEALIQNADRAMYHAKTLYGGGYSVYDPSLQSAIQLHDRLEQDLEQAFEQGELELYYQPIVALDTGEVTAFEALLRWQQEDGSFVSPADFIPLAEKSELICKIGTWVLVEGCRQLASWQKLCPELSLNINLSGKQLAQGDFARQVSATLRRFNLFPEQLCLEMTESLLLTDCEMTLLTLCQLRQLGVDLQIDDFGTGYSSLAYLQKLPVSSLKVDRSFVCDLHANKTSREIVQVIMALSKALGLHVIAEGIETAEQLDNLHALGCTTGQGFLFSGALPALDCQPLLLKSQSLMA